MKNVLAGVLTEDEYGYSFRYEPEYLDRPDAEPISLTMPLRADPYRDKVLFPFFDGLIPEGWLLDIADKSWKIDLRDRMSLLPRLYRRGQCRTLRKHGKPCIDASIVIRN